MHNYFDSFIPLFFKLCRCLCHEDNMNVLIVRINFLDFFLFCILSHFDLTGFMIDATLI